MTNPFSLIYRWAQEHFSSQVLEHRTEFLRDQLAACQKENDRLVREQEKNQEERRQFEREAQKAQLRIRELEQEVLGYQDLQTRHADITLQLKEAHARADGLEHQLQAAQQSAMHSARDYDPYA
jgi:predicted RNase H-like nuclease (RuvC/YqgF family)